MPVSLTELTFDLANKDGPSLEETVLHLLQRGVAGFRAVVRGADDPAAGGRVRAAVTKASDRVIEAVAEAPLKARQAAVAGEVLALVDPAALERKGVELLGRGCSDLVRVMAGVMATRHLRPAAARRLEATLALADGRLTEALRCLELIGDKPSPTDLGFRALLLAEAGHLGEAAVDLSSAIAGMGGGPGPGAVEEAVSAILELAPPGDPDGAAAAAIDRLLEGRRPLVLSLLARGADERLSEARREGLRAMEAVRRALSGLDQRTAAACTALRGKSDGSAPDEIDLAGVATAAKDAALMATALGPDLLPCRPPAVGRLDLRALIEQVLAETTDPGGPRLATAEPEVILTPGDPIAARGDPALTAPALALILRDLSQALPGDGESAAGRVTVAGVEAPPSPGLGPWPASLVFTGGPEEEFHPSLTGPGGGRPVGPARLFSAARAAFEAQGGGVIWRLEEGAEGGPGRWSLWAWLPAAAPPQGGGATGGFGTAAHDPVRETGLVAPLVEGSGGNAPASSFLASLHLAVRAAAGGIPAELAGLAEEVRLRAGRTMTRLTTSAEEARRGSLRSDRLAEMTGLAERAHWEIRGLRTLMGFCGPAAPSHDELNAVINQAIHLSRPGLIRGDQVTFLPGTGLPKLSLDRERLTTALVGLILEAAGPGDADGEVRVTTAHRAGEALVRLSLAGPGRPSPTGLARALAEVVAGEHGGTLRVAAGADRSAGSGGSEVTIDFVVSETDRRLASSFPEYLRLGGEARRAVKTAEAMADGQAGGDPGLRPFLWRKAVELELAVRVRPRLQRHQFLAKALDAVEHGKPRLSRAGEARLDRLVAAFPGQEPPALRARLLSVVEAISGDRLERVLGDLRSLAVLLVGFATDGGEAAVQGFAAGAGVDDPVGLARILYALGGAAAEDQAVIELSRAVLSALVRGT
ncbi:MAG TPA: hypothetical protein VGL40_11245 [Bacillota bacterium]